LHNLKFSNLILLFVLTLLSFRGAAQIKLQTYTTATDTFYWKRYIRVPRPARINLNQYTVANPGKAVGMFLAKNIGRFPQFTNDSLPLHTIKDLKKCLYAIDVNGDNLPDMIFSGYSGGESDVVQIYLNRKDSFDLVFEDYQYFTKFRKVQGKLVELQTGDIGTPGSYLYFTHDYRVNQENNQPVFIKVRQHVVYKNSEDPTPTQSYPVPVPFEAKSDTMLLRASPAKQNEPFIPDLNTFGNIVAKYRSKTKGFALAKRSYGKGNDWYFVEISPGTMPSASILYGLERMPSFIRGWVSGQSIFVDFK